ncbi:MAG: 1,4-dihydroxy-6-naphthoate synthase [Bacteroidota bacterium]
MQINIAISPCPNDTFMFEALYNKRFDTKGLEFLWHFEDIETLNNSAKSNIHDVTKISFNALFANAEKYIMLNSGAALGFNCGPQIISKKNIDTSNLAQYKFAIPGKQTTANLLLSAFYPEIIHKKEMIFSDIEKAVLNEEVDAGLIIHESRFTYIDKGLKKVLDLGEVWENEYKLPLPLGAIAIKKSFEAVIALQVSNLIHQSIEFAFNNREVVMPFVRAHAQELDDKVTNAHIDLYVNKYSLNLGENGRNAIRILNYYAKNLGFVQNIE